MTDPERRRYIPGKSCLECGGLIPWRAGPERREQAKFCGNACKFAWQRKPGNAPNFSVGKQTATCQAPGCGKKFEYYPSVQPNAEACSPECRSILHSIKMTGRRPSNGIYTSPSTFRAIIRQEFYDRCALCGWDLAPCDVAHIEPEVGNILDNVVMLCPNDHRLFDRGQIPVELVRQARLAILKHQPSPP